MDAEFNYTAAIRGKMDANKSYDFMQDMVDITATADQLELTYHEPTETRGEDGTYRTTRKSFRFAFSYAEAKRIAAVVATAEAIAALAGITINQDKE